MGADTSAPTSFTHFIRPRNALLKELDEIDIFIDPNLASNIATYFEDDLNSYCSKLKDALYEIYDSSDRENLQDFDDAINEHIRHHCQVNLIDKVYLAANGAKAKILASMAGFAEGYARTLQTYVEKNRSHFSEIGRKQLRECLEHNSALPEFTEVKSVLEGIQALFEKFALVGHTWRMITKKEDEARERLVCAKAKAFEQRLRGYDDVFGKNKPGDGVTRIRHFTHVRGGFRNRHGAVQERDVGTRTHDLRHDGFGCVEHVVEDGALVLAEVGVGVDEHAQFVVGHLAVGFVRIEAEQPHDAVRVLADQPNNRLAHLRKHVNRRHHGTRDLLVALHGDTLRYQFGNDDRAIRDDQCQRDGGQGSGDVMRHTPVFDDRGKAFHEASKRVAAIERKLAKLEEQKADLEAQMAAHDPSDYEGLGKLNEQLQAVTDESESLEMEWMELSEQLE